MEPMNEASIPRGGATLPESLLELRGKLINSVGRMRNMSHESGSWKNLVENCEAPSLGPEFFGTYFRGLGRLPVYNRFEANKLIRTDALILQFHDPISALPNQLSLTSQD